jgi:hypothetical protein
VHALTSDKPKRHYHPNADARGAIFMKRFLGDAVVDRVLTSMMMPK